MKKTPKNAPCKKVGLLEKQLENIKKKSTAEITAEEWEFLRNAGVCNGCGGNCGNTKNASSLPLFLDEKWSKNQGFTTPHDFETRHFVAQTLKITSWLVEKKQKGACKIQKFLARLISPIFFEASCDKHDFGYWKGGDENRRKECDEKFLEAILRDVSLYFCYQTPQGAFSFCFTKIHLEYQKHLGGKMPLAYAHHGTDFHRGLPPKNPGGFSSKIRKFSLFFKKMYFIFLAYLFYFSVRIGGRKYFNFTNK